jgi:1-acyl-sn-glycerol-3-phosphate acyltransferase
MSDSLPSASLVSIEERSRLRKPFSSIVAGVKFIWLALWLGLTTSAVFIPIMLAAPFATRGHFAFNLARFWAWTILTVSGVRLSIKGKDKIDQKQTYFIISNHQSHFDGPALAATLGMQFRWIAKKELLKIPIFGQALKAVGNIFIDRSDTESAIRTLQEGIDRLPPGVGVMVFAEGTRSRRGQIGAFKKGGFKAALQLGYPILPVTINGSGNALPRNGLVFHPGPIDVIIGDPIETRDFRPPQLAELMETTRQAIMANFTTTPLAAAAAPPTPKPG